MGDWAACGGRNVVVLGCTGSIGDTTFRALEGLPDEYHVVGLSGGQRLDKLVQRARQWRPRMVSVARPEDAASVRDQLPGVEVFAGAEGLLELAGLDGAEVIVNGLVGAVGLLPTLAALDAGKVVAMANKEPLVMAGNLILARAQAGGGTILPLDSEPNALWQCLRGESPGQIRRLILTASGGAFRGRSLAEMKDVTPAQALQHPTWQMGEKLTIDSATLMNKGFEAIETTWLFGVSIDQVDVIVHRESVIHSMAELVDGSLLAHLGQTDMLLPIQFALTQPDRRPTCLESLDLIALGSLHFEAPDRVNFPCLDLCFEAARRGGTAPALLNAANEVSVEAFVRGRIGFLDIYEVNQRVLEQCGVTPAASLDAVLAADAEGRRAARAAVAVVPRR